MEYQIHVWVLKKVLEKYENEYLSRLIQYEPVSKKMSVDADRVTKTELLYIQELLQEHYDRNVPDKNDKSTHNKYYPFLLTARKIQSAIDLEASGDGTRKVKSLEQMVLATKLFFKDFPHKIVFIKSRDGFWLPYILSSVNYTPYNKRMNDRQQVTFYAKASKRGSTISESFTVYTAGLTIPQLLKSRGWIVETPELIEAYRESYRRYIDLSPRIGQQVNVQDIAFGDKGMVPMTVDGINTKAVIDDTSDSKENDTITEMRESKFDAHFWSEQGIEVLDIFAQYLEDPDSETLDEVDNRTYSVLPVHTYIKCFDLKKHRFVKTHVKNILEYQWDHNLADKLILDKSTKDLITILVDSTRNRREDIIAGKMSGTIVLATGLPGVGKTLTAEVFSEKIEKPLYVVQCSQLGIKVDTIEGNLNSILSRASRWGAILLIDEADVYIRDRGEDIVHNAIVGVFLRLIEYYNGVLFMTSNRGDIIDDAIISRATAWIKYENPDANLLKEIWAVLAKQFEVNLTDSDINNLVTRIPNISGRTVRNLLKLLTSLDYEDNKSEANVERLIEVSKYQKLS